MTAPPSSFPPDQSAGAVQVRLDGDALCWAWTPNLDEDHDGFRIDLGKRIAELIHRGRGRPMPPAPSWEADPDSTTECVAFTLGTDGTATIAGSAISGTAHCRLYWSMTERADLIADQLEAREHLIEALDAYIAALRGDDTATEALRERALAAARAVLRRRRRLRTGTIRPSRRARRTRGRGKRRRDDGRMTGRSPPSTDHRADRRSGTRPNRRMRCRTP